MIYLALMFVFFTIGLFTIGGGYAMIPMIRDQVVGRGWLTMDEITTFIGIAEATPGPFAVNTATLVGFQQGSQYGVLGGILGGVLTTLSVVIPSFIIIILIARNIDKFLKYKKVNWAITGIKAIVVGLIFSVAFDLFIKFGFRISVSFSQFLKNDIKSYNYRSIDFIALGIMAFIFILKRFIYKKISPIFLILISGALGLLLYGLLPIIL